MRPARLLAAFGIVVVTSVGVLAWRTGYPVLSCGVLPVDYTPPPSPTGPGAAVRHVVVVAMENTPAVEVYQGADTGYLQSLLTRGAHATNFVDLLKPAVPSEPHYLLMEAGTATFADRQLCDNEAPSPDHVTASTDHLVTQMAAASPPVSWMSYQEGLDPATTGACPIVASGAYAPKHNPFVFFTDIVGNPPSSTNEFCALHHRPASRLAEDLQSGALADYVFVTPDLCNDMHDRCGSARSREAGGDEWLRVNLPPILDFADRNDGVVFLVWDEGSLSDSVLPFYAFGPAVKPAYAASGTFTHRSMLRSIETMFGLPILPTVKGANDLAEMFVGDRLPVRQP